MGLKTNLNLKTIRARGGKWKPGPDLNLNLNHLVSTRVVLWLFGALLFSVYRRYSQLSRVRLRNLLRPSTFKFGLEWKDFQSGLLKSKHSHQRQSQTETLSQTVTAKPDKKNLIPIDQIHDVGIGDRQSQFGEWGRFEAQVIVRLRVTSHRGLRAVLGWKVWFLVLR
jgi:hypothetical protein